MDSSRTRALQHAHTLIMHPLLVLPHSLGGGSCSPSNTTMKERERKKSVVMWFSLTCTCTCQRKAGMTRQCLERCFQKDTVKKLWMLYRFNLQIWVSYTCVANHHRSIILWSPIQFRVSRSPRAPQPYPNPGHSHRKAWLPSSPEVCGCACVLLCVCVCVLRETAAQAKHLSCWLMLKCAEPI